jgi:hypothetical protein
MWRPHSPRGVLCLTPQDGSRLRLFDETSVGRPSAAVSGRSYHAEADPRTAPATNYTTGLQPSTSAVPSASYAQIEDGARNSRELHALRDLVQDQGQMLQEIERELRAERAAREELARALEERAAVFDQQLNEQGGASAAHKGGRSRGGGGLVFPSYCHSEVHAWG